MNLCQLEAAGSIGLMTSIPQATNRQGEHIAFSLRGGTRIKSQCTWHLWHFCTNLQKSFSIVIQKYPACRIFLTKVTPFICVPQTPTCICSISFIAQQHPRILEDPNLVSSYKGYTAYRLLLVGRSVFGICFRLQVLLYVKIPRETLWLCFNMGTMDWMFFQFNIQIINIICIRMFNHRSDGGKSINQFILYSRSMS